MLERTVDNNLIRAEHWGRKAAASYAAGGQPECPFMSGPMQKAWARGFQAALKDWNK